ncbi:PREDICTED: DNA excision repair protein ERCC-6-like 2 isoform X2 [Gavialis gangeticus]|uniref:DNA excision repair protein ERCC-6-like 2 isoform X2 n=1 Tax=Gavialis gangeticus TaxID=94835 RepID=UPI00092EF26F|nr:PREDICTED: DNA excision repair protein ERCC-6-like 2 isoform X2 [Gavialis gangeticus]
MCEDTGDRWHVGEKCLAPFPGSEKLCEATIKSIEKDKNGKSFALVSFLDSEEKRIVITKLCKVKADRWKSLIFDDEDLEKPYFPDRRLPSPAVAFELSENGDCIPYTINRYLRDYQREGVQFLYGHYAHKRGCILGDDMGLGKTIQVISFLAAVLNKKGTRKDIENNMPEFLLRTVKKERKCVPKKTFLIVAPLSVLYNWRDELDTWGYFRIGVLHGSQKDNELTRIKQGKCEVVLTTYETLRLCLDELNSVEWSAVIVDEAHRIKNPKAQITKTMKGLKCIVRIGLTGTILQNNMKELWCVMDWAVPGLLGSKVYFKKKFSDPVEHGQRHTATKRELATGRKAMQKLAGKMSGWFLRRTKALISDQLPKKEDRIVYCSLTEFQKAVYQAVLETEEVNLILRAWAPCSCNSGRKRKNCCYKTNSHGETMKALYFSYLTILRKVANHAALLQTENTSKQQKTHIKRVCNQVFSKFPDFVQLSNDAAFETISDPKYSGKMKQLHCVVVGSENAKRYFEAVQGSKEHKGELFGIRNLFKLRTHGSCLTKDILEREGKVEAGVMTATTWLKEEPPSCRSEMHAESGYEEDKDPVRPREHLMKDEFDFSSEGSSDEIMGNSRKKQDKNNASNTDPQGQPTLMQCGFSKLLEREIKTTLERDHSSGSDHSSSDCPSVRQRLNVNGKCAGLQKTQSHNHILGQWKTAKSRNSSKKPDIQSLTIPADLPVLSASEDERDMESKNKEQCISNQVAIVMDTEGSSEESDDIIFPSHVPAHQAPVPTKSVNKYEPLSGKSEGSDTKNNTILASKGDCQQSLNHNTWSTSRKTNFLKHAQEMTTDIQGTSDISDESDDIEMFLQSKPKKLRHVNSFKWKKKCNLNKGFGNSSKTMLQVKTTGKLEKESDSQTIDEFSSSEDNLPVEKAHFTKQSHRCKIQRYRIPFESKSPCQIKGASVTLVKPSCFHSPKTAVCKEASARQEEQGSLDRYLDGVQEVAYIHSNQNVVGSSKAENHMSRWAVRDVFELKQFSQLPANVPVYSAKEDEKSPEENPKEATLVKKSTERGQQRRQQMAGKQFHLCITHPVIQKKKKLHRVGSTTFLIGKTPTGIRRKQFEEMVSYFNMASVEELAEHIAKATSEIRQKMLKDFYAAKYPELENIFSIEVPACVSKRCEEDEVCSAHSRKRKSTIKFGKSWSSASAAEGPPHGTTEICSQKRNKGEAEQVHNNSCIQDDVCLNAEYKQLPTVITQDSISGRNSRAFKDFMASGSLSSKSEIIEVLSANATCRQQDSEGTVSPRKRSLSQSENGEKLFCKKNSFVDLLGDTSILSDLFKSDGNRPTQLPRRFPSEPASKAKERPKDFWDMLNEENDESIGKLTDVAVIEELCERAPLVALTKKEEEACENSLWKKNENFLWKKSNATEPVPGTSLDA